MSLLSCISNVICINILITYLKQKGFLPFAGHVYMYLFLSLFFKFPYIPFLSQYTFSNYEGRSNSGIHLLPFHILSPKITSGYNCEVNTSELANLSGSPVNGFSGSMPSLVVLAVLWEELLKGAFGLQVVKR